MKYRHFLISFIAFCCLIIPLLPSNANGKSAPPIRKIYLEKRNVFDTTGTDLCKFIAKAGNAIHCMTRDYVIENELLFDRGDPIDDDLIEETERNLRNLGIFSSVIMELDTLNNIYITTQDSWTTRLNLVLDIGGREKAIGGGIEEVNFLGTNTSIGFSSVYKSKDQTGWQNYFYVQNDRIFKFGLGASFSYLDDKYLQAKSAGIYKGFISLDDKYAGGIFASKSQGERYIYTHITDFERKKTLLHFSDQDLYACFARSWRNIDRIFFSTSIALNKAERQDHKIAYDNMGKFLVAFSSSSEEWIKTSRINSQLIEDLAVGGWGSAVLGRIFPMQNALMPAMFYVAGAASRSYLSPDETFYAFGKLQASTCFSEAEPRFTYQEFYGLAFYRFTSELILGGRIRQQTTWNYGFYHRQMMLDNSTGLRGYRISDLVGDNRIVSNIEFRWLSGIPLWIFNLGINAFWDAGTVWRRGIPLVRTQWHHSAGIGIRLYNLMGDKNSGSFRIDFAYNFDEKRVAEVIFSTNQFFSFFSGHSFEAPKVLGIDGDY